MKKQAPAVKNTNGFRKSPSFYKTLAWSFYDWANSAHSTIIVTFIFSVYFARSVYGDETQGSAVWAHMSGVAALLIAVCAPFFGALSDALRQKRLWLFVFTMICIITTAGLWFVEPDKSFIPLALVLLTLSLFSVEMGESFNNAILPDITTEKNIGKVSGLGWGLGYIGGLVCLVLSLFLFVGLGNVQPILALDKDSLENIRAVAPFAALWMLVFSLPIFIAYRDIYHTKPPRDFSGKVFKEAFNDLKTTILSLIQIKDKNLLLYLLSSAIYRDGLITIFAIGGLYAAGVHHMSFDEILIFAIGLNITAGLGSFGFSFLNDKLGSKQTIIISLIGLIGVGALILMTNDKATFMTLGYALGLFMGPCQSASRVFMAQISPKDKMGEYFGFYALTGKSVAVTGPFLYGFCVTLFDSQKAGMLSLLGLLLLGLLILLKVRDIHKS